MQTIRWHAENHQAECAGALSDLLPNMYVDDLVVSCDSVADARRIAKEATELLEKGGFHLAKWASNSSAAVDEILAKDQEPSNGSRLWKTLGIFCQRECDLLSSRTPERAAEFPDTKRGVLKALASVFDPLGCLAPYTVNAKIIIQLLWQCGVAWDDPLPPETKAQWRPWKEELPDISRIVMEAPLVQALTAWICIRFWKSVRHCRVPPSDAQRWASRNSLSSGEITSEDFRRVDHQISEVTDFGGASRIIVMDQGPSGGGCWKLKASIVDHQNGGGTVGGVREVCDEEA
ncbi:hypothetical protein T02_9755 [Trichinella nativa]|uniref:Reverse transcriptase domain-containing protein n=1 Tax=Trichinella nativa TaxID=6335 RepID=A0A0V1KQ17_9BILA|nr:hypothetical protein T02_9755 [Trichinella nativa]